jgi:hypothetical protein
MNRKQRREADKKRQTQMEQVAAAFKAAEAAGEDTHFLLFGPSSVTAMWTGEKSRGTVARMMEVLTGHPVNLAGKKMLNWTARTPAEKELVREMREMTSRMIVGV